MDEQKKIDAWNELLIAGSGGEESFLKVEVHLRHSPEYRVNGGPLVFTASDDYVDEGSYHIHSDEGETIVIPLANILYVWKYPIDEDEEQ